MSLPPAKRQLIRSSALAALMFGLAAPACAAAPIPATDATAQPAARIVARADGLEVRRGALLMRVTALTDSTIRVRIAPGGTLPEDASWAVPAKVRTEHVAVTAAAD